MRTVLLSVVLAISSCATGGRIADEADDREDLVVLSSGESVSGHVLAESNDAVVVAQRYGTFTFNRAEVRSITRGAVAVKSAAQFRSGRLPPFSTLVRALTARWSTKVQQIPATVIETGVLRHVPYLSHRAGGVEINVYGDPDSPCGIEVGAKEPTDFEKQQLRALVSEVLPQQGDRDTARGLGLDEAKVESNELTFEVTPPTAPDAYGAWWISVYDVAALDASRASDSELEMVAGQSHDASGWAGSSDTTVPPPLSWRPPPSSGGRVYVRGYFKKNGTYVRSHTRRR